MPPKKKPVKRKTPVATPKRRRPASTAGRKTKRGTGKIANYVVPLFFIVCILTGLGFLGVMGYRTATASEFFDVKKIDIRGVSRSSRDEMEKIVASSTERSGAWNADITGIKERIEKLMFVKHAAVSRVLPNGVRVDVTERVPQAIVRLASGDFLVDAEGVVLTTVSKPEEKLPFAIRGWDESRTDKGTKDNIERVKLYQKMLDEWQTYELSARVKEVNLADLHDPKVMVEDSGVNIPIALGKDNYGKRLLEGLKVLAGKGARDMSVNSAGLYPVLEYPNK